MLILAKSAHATVSYARLDKHRTPKRLYPISKWSSMPHLLCFKSTSGCPGLVECVLPLYVIVQSSTTHGNGVRDNNNCTALLSTAPPLEETSLLQCAVYQKKLVFVLQRHVDWGLCSGSTDVSRKHVALTLVRANQKCQLVWCGGTSGCQQDAERVGQVLYDLETRIVLPPRGMLPFHQGEELMQAPMLAPGAKSQPCSSIQYMSFWTCADMAVYIFAEITEMAIGIQWTLNNPCYDEWDNLHQHVAEQQWAANHCEQLWLVLWFWTCLLGLLFFIISLLYSESTNEKWL